MRTIAEVAKNIKSILNNIERTQDCNGETLVAIDEFVNEILSIDSVEREKTKAAKELFKRIYRNDCFSPREIELFETIENALGFKLYFWQKTFLIVGHFRQTGETTAICLKKLFGTTPIDYSRRPQNAREHCERMQMMKIKKQLQDAGIATVPIFTREKEVRDYKATDGLRSCAMTIDEIHPKFFV